MYQNREQFTDSKGRNYILFIDDDEQGACCALKFQTPKKFLRHSKSIKAANIKLLFHPDENLVEFCDIFVEKEFRGAGLARFLLGLSEYEARKWHYPKIETYAIQEKSFWENQLKHNWVKYKNRDREYYFKDIF